MKTNEITDTQAYVSEVFEVHVPLTYLLWQEEGTPASGAAWEFLREAVKFVNACTREHLPLPYITPEVLWMLDVVEVRMIVEDHLR